MISVILNSDNETHIRVHSSGNFSFIKYPTDYHSENNDDRKPDIYNQIIGKCIGYSFSNNIIFLEIEERRVGKEC